MHYSGNPPPRAGQSLKVVMYRAGVHPVYLWQRARI